MQIVIKVWEREGEGNVLTEMKKIKTERRASRKKYADGQRQKTP